MNDRPAVSTEQPGERLIWALTRCYHRLAVLSDALHGPFGISTGERATMLLIAEQPGLTISRIAEERGVSRQFIHRIAGGLMERGWLIAEANPRHARSPCLALTELGAAEVALMRERECGLWNELGTDLDAHALGEAAWPIEMLTARVDRLIARLD